MRIAKLALAPFLLVHLAACTLFQEGAEGRNRRTVEAIDENTRSNYGAARAEITGDVGVLDEYESPFEESYRVASQARFDAIEAKIAEQKQSVSDFMTTLGALVGTIAPGAAALATKLHSYIDASSNSVRTAIDKEVDTQRKELVARISDTDAVVSAANSKLASFESKLENVVASLPEKDVKELGEKLGRLVEDNRSKFVELEKTFTAELTAAAKERGLTDAEMESLKAKTSENPWAALSLGGGGALAAVIALLRTLGKSRSQPQIDELYDLVKDLTVDVAAKTGSTDLRAARRVGRRPATSGSSSVEG